MQHPLDNMPTGGNLIIIIIKKIFGEGRLIHGNEKEGKDEGMRYVYIGLLILALILVVCTEPLKVIMRKRIGKSALSLTGLIAGAILMFAWAAITGFGFLDVYYSNKDDLTGYGRYVFNPISLWLIIVAYSAFGVYILKRGITEYDAAKTRVDKPLREMHYRGDCIVLAKLVNKGVPQRLVWCRAEPWHCFKIGFLITILHPLLGLPLLLMSISFAVNECFHISYKWKRLNVM